MADWIIPCNLKYYDVVGAFNKLHCIDWKQSTKSICVGDHVFIYVGKPIMAIKYKCLVNKVNLHSIEINDSDFIINGENFEKYGCHMELKLLKKYSDDHFTLELLKAHGLKGNIQGPRRMIDSIQKLFV